MKPMPVTKKWTLLNWLFKRDQIIIRPLRSRLPWNFAISLPCHFTTDESHIWPVRSILSPNIAKNLSCRFTRAKNIIRPLQSLLQSILTELTETSYIQRVQKLIWPLRSRIPRYFAKTLPCRFMRDKNIIRPLRSRLSRIIGKNYLL